MPDSNIEFLRKDTYIRAIENSIGSRLFNTLYVRYRDSGKTEDILDDGTFACAHFVSGILSLFSYVDRPHATVATLGRVLAESEMWELTESDAIEAGDVIFWERKTFSDGTSYAHVGFASSPTEAVSTDFSTRSVVRHPISNQKVERVYRLR